MDRNQHFQSAVGRVAELQGLYGPFQFPEKLLQKIWLRGDFDATAIRLADGRSLEVLDPGRWNLLGGPDFLGARLRFGGGPPVEGDVEIHVHAADWVAHAHARDPAYDGVVLHVVLFPPNAAQRALNWNGREIPTLVLLPLLHHDLEQFAAEETVEVLTGRMGETPPEELLALEPDELMERLRGHARARWRQKVHFASLRIQRLGWGAACHHTALEILGYRFNRSPMLRAASRWPLAAWREADFDPDTVLDGERGRWSVQGVRPANRPRARLRQYAAWINAQPNWPELLKAVGSGLPIAESEMARETREARSVSRLAAWRREFSGLGGDAVGGTRLDNLVCDGFLPLLAANENVGRDWSGLWRHWWPGDQPPRILSQLRQLGVVAGCRRPASHGVAQGLVGWLLEASLGAAHEPPHSGCD